MISGFTDSVRALYREALALPEADRARFVAERAGTDTALRVEVERLLAENMTEAVPASPSVALGPGVRLGAYVIEERIGAGGMGEVFGAVDSRLDRKVAIKVCANRFGERFEREAKSLSALNHPHVCMLFDVGPNYLVMELIDGESLAARLERGALPLTEAARWGAEIAEALAEAHRAGIVHRDVKPQNVMLTRHGVKVLDFGIATLVGSGTLTSTGAIIGTAAYSAPEQLAGEPATARSDLYALGVVLHEMLTGQRPARNVSMPATGSRKAGAFDALVAELLERDPVRRPESAAAVAARLRAIAAPPQTWNLRRASIVAAVLAALGVAAVGIWMRGAGDESAALEVVRLVPATPLAGRKSDPAYSPDGTTLAFVWDGPTGDEQGIYVLRDGEDTPIRLTSDETDISPAWSPDGKQIAFLRLRPGRSNELMLIGAPGSATASVETKLRDVRQPEIVNRLRRPALAWAADGAAIVLPLPDAESGFTSLFRVGLDGTPPRRVVASQGGLGDSGPAVSRDGRWLAYADLEAQNSHAFVVPLGADGLAAAERQSVPDGVGGVRALAWSPDGEQLFWSNGARLMEWRRGSTVARTVYAAADVFQSLTVVQYDALGPDIVFANAGGALELGELTLRDGGRTATSAAVPLIRRAGTAFSPGLSPDGRWLAFEAPGKDGNLEVWLAGARGENPRSIAALAVGVPLRWSADSRRLTFHARVEGAAQLFVVDLDEQGNVTSLRQLTQAPFSLFGPVFSADGRYLYAISNRNTNAQRVVRVHVTGGDLEDLFEGTSHGLSIDGKRIYYGKASMAGIYERSLEGDVASNPETLLLEDYVGPLGFVAGPTGVVYVGRDEQRRPVALRYFDFALRRSFDLGPPPDSTVPVLTLSGDGTRLVFERASPVLADLTRMELRLAR